MIPIRIVETEREDFDEPVVELWMENEFVGMVFWDGSSTIVQIYPAADGDVHDLEMRDLFRALEMAERIVDPLAFDQVEGLVQVGDARAQAKREEEESDWSEEDPATVELLSEFDPLAAFRSEDGEGFFPRDVALRFVHRCGELRLAVVEMEGFDLVGGRAEGPPGSRTRRRTAAGHVARRVPVRTPTRRHSTTSTDGHGASRWWLRSSSSSKTARPSSPKSAYPGFATSYLASPARGMAWG